MEEVFLHWKIGAPSGPIKGKDVVQAFWYTIIPSPLWRGILFCIVLFMSEYLFTSESVSEGHPDKVADQISDAILDAILEQDPYARVAAETLVNTGLCVLAGEITTIANIDYIGIARKTITDIGYNSSDLCYDGTTLAVMVCYDKQSPDIAQGVDE